MARLKTILLLALILLPISTALTADLAETDPLTVEQGDVVTAYVRVTNTDDEIKEDIRVVMTPPDGVRLLKETQKVETLTTLGGLEDYVIPYEIYVEEDAPSRSLPFTVELSSKNDGLKTQTLIIPVQSIGNPLSVSRAILNPNPIRPGQNGDATIALTNLGNDVLRNVDVDITVENTPLKARDQTNVISFPRLDGDSTQTVTVPVTVPPSTEVGQYDLPISVTYETNDGSSVTREFMTSYLVDSEPELLVTVDDVQGEVNTKSEASVAVTNAGLSDVKRLALTLSHGNTSRTTYIGDLDIDDFDIVSYSFTPSTKDEEIDVELRYKTTTNEERVTTETVSVSIDEQTESGSSTWILVLGLVVIVGGIVWWRRRE